MSNSPGSLTPAMFNVLLALADNDKHGYAILKEVEISTGALYSILKRLLEEGLIVELTGRQAPEHEDQRRRYYRLTAEGRTVAVEEARRMETLVAKARAKRLIHQFRSA